MKLAVVICSHNSRLDYLQRVLDALRGQTMPVSEWELVLVDNGSREPLAPKVDLSWHPHGCVARNDVPENEASLVGARVRGMGESTAALLVFVDDDNVLAPDYLVQAVAVGERHPNLGAWGGQIVLCYEDPARRLPAELEGLLCFRELTTARWSNLVDQWDCTPWGAGLCVRRRVADAYLNLLEREPDRRRLDPNGREMRFGGDTDLVNTGLRFGLGKGVFPELSLTHLIPARRCEPVFIERALEAHGYSAALHGWIETGRVTPPRTDVRFWLVELARWPRRSRWDRLRWRALRRGQWRAYRELASATPRRLEPSPSIPPNR